MERRTGGLRRPGESPTGKTGAHRAVGRQAAPAEPEEPSDTESSAARRPVGRGQAQAVQQVGGPTTLGGMGMGAKFSLFIALTVAIASSLLVVGGYISTADEMDKEIDDAGIRLTKVVAALAVPKLKEIKMTGGSANPGRNADLAAQRLVELAPPENQVAAKKFVAEITAATALITELTTSPLTYLSPEKADLMQLKTPEIINVVILLSDDRTSVASIRGEGGISISNRQPRVTGGDVDIEEAIYTSGGPGKRARIYKKSVLDERGVEIGKVNVYLSAAKIDDTKSKILTAMLIPLFVAVIIGAGIGFYLSTSVTRPLKTLLNDINIVSGGDLAHVTKPASTDEIGYLAKTFNLMTQSLATAHEAELENKAMEHELNIATEIQAGLLPHRIPKIPGYEIGTYYRPSKEVGGDYYDFIQIDQNHLGVIVADVSGKGIPGSMVMTMARALIRMEAERNLSTADTLIKTNRILARDIRRGMFVTALYALLDIRTKIMLVSSAGHNPMIIWRKNGGKYDLINPNGIALGFDKGPIFERTIKEQSVQLYAGDRIVLYTDGCVEAMNSKNVEYGDERFYKLVQAIAEKDSNVFIKTMVDSLDEHKGDAPQHDDITLVTVRLVPQ